MARSAMSELEELAKALGFSEPTYGHSLTTGDGRTVNVVTVTVDGKSFEGIPGRLKQSQRTAAERAIEDIKKRFPDLPTQDESLKKKTLLQEELAMFGQPLPVYSTTVSGASHTPVFTSTVTVSLPRPFLQTLEFTGKPAGRKRLAEMSAAAIALDEVRKKTRCAADQPPQQPPQQVDEAHDHDHDRSIVCTSAEPPACKGEEDA